MKRLILASGSPRRRELLTPYFPFLEIMVSAADENIPGNDRPEVKAMVLAMKKAQEISTVYPDATVVGADTIVVSRGKILGKPRDEDQARSMLMELCDHSHEVITGVCIIEEATEKKRVFFDRTTVRTTAYSDTDIAGYIATGEPLDKAGAYGIQGAFAPFVAGINGSYHNVVGLPIHLVYDVLKKEFGFGDH